jgi:hypothetical protein
MSLSSIFSRIWRLISPPWPESVEALGDEPDAAPAEQVPASKGNSVDELDFAFEAVFSKTGGCDGSSADEGPNEHDLAQNQELFAGIAANHLRPIKDFVFELETGTAPKEWIEVCRPVIASLDEAAGSMNLAEIASLLKALDKELEAALSDQGPWPSTAWNDRILFVYSKLVALEPDAFAVDDSDRRRESIIIHSLLRQIPEVGYVTLEKLYRVGLTSRETLFQANAKELVSTAGIPKEISARICDEVRSYKERIDGADQESLAENARKRLLEQVPALRRHHEELKSAFEAASVDRGLSARKRDLRLKRRFCALEIEVILAEMGELSLVREIQALAFEQRIKKLEQYLALPDEIVADADVSDVDRKPSPTVAGT